MRLSERSADILEATQAAAQGTNQNCELLWRKELYAHLKDVYYEAFERFLTLRTAFSTDSRLALRGDGSPGQGVLV